MRHTVQQQEKIVPIPNNHQHAKELQEISNILDNNQQIYDWVLNDLIDGGIDPNNGREGMTAEQVFRALIIYQMNDFGYEGLSFHIVDSACYKAFCRIGRKQPKKKTLQRNIKKIKAETIEAFNHLLIKEGKRRGVEQGRKVRIDCTVEGTNIHEPTDSSLLFDVVRVLDRLIKQAKEVGFDIEVVDHTRRAKRRALNIKYTKNKDKRVKLYRELVKITEKTVGYALRSISTLDDPHPSLGLDGLLVGLSISAELEQFIGLGRKVIEQTKRRVWGGETVPAEEKIVSIFEPHTDIIKKDRRETLFGHKLCLTQGSSGLFLDCLIVEGNPSDTTLAVETVERQKGIFGRVPRQAAFDGGFASRPNLKSIKKLGVQDVMFHKKQGLKIPEMVKSSWVYKRLRRFRAGIEGGISFLKRCFGLRRCRWSGFASFKAYTWASIVSANLLILARHALS